MYYLVEQKLSKKKKKIPDSSNVYVCVYVYGPYAFAYNNCKILNEMIIHQFANKLLQFYSQKDICSSAYYPNVTLKVC